MVYDALYITYALGLATMIGMLPTVFQKVLVKPCHISKKWFVVIYLISILFSWLGIIFIILITRSCKCCK